MGHGGATNQVDSLTAWSQDGVDATASLCDYYPIPGAVLEIGRTHEH